MILFESSRSFQLWRAVVGHNQVLLRSTKTDNDPTRIDILFKPVRALKLRTDMDGLRIREASHEEVDQIALESGERAGTATFFILESAGLSGYIVADLMVTAEDEGEYLDPGQLLIG